MRVIKNIHNNVAVHSWPGGNSKMTTITGDVEISSTNKKTDLERLTEIAVRNDLPTHPTLTCARSEKSHIGN